MKTFFLTFALVFVAAQALPRTKEASPAIQKLTAALKQSNESFVGTPEYAEVVNKFNETISIVFYNVIDLRRDGHELLESSEIGKTLLPAFDGLLDPHFFEVMVSLLGVFSSLPSASSFEEAVTSSYAVWQKAVERRGIVNYAIIDLVAAATDVDFYNKIALPYNIRFAYAVGNLYSVLYKYLPL